MSHPLWVRGLKFLLQLSFGLLQEVAPFMGAWIEILTRYQSNLLRVSRTLYGCVD